MISETLKKVYSEIHKNTSFGKRAKIPDFLKVFINEYDPKTILDFGCGKGNLVKTLAELYPSIVVSGYDPANPDFDHPFSEIDMIVSTDVLEHVEYENIDSVIEMFYTKALYQYHLISCAPAKLILPDGRNAHLIQESPEWWKDRFTGAGFSIIKEDYREFKKYSKQLRKEMPVKNYYIMAERNGTT